MNDTPGQGRPCVLLLQEGAYDARIWDPLIDAAVSFRPVAVTPPTSNAMFSNEAWAEYMISWLVSEAQLGEVAAVVCHGMAFGAGLLAAQPNLTQGPILLVDPPVEALIEGASELVATWGRRVLQDEAARSRLAAMFDSIGETEFQELGETGRLSAAATEAWIATVSEQQPIDLPALRTLVKEMASARLGPLLIAGVSLSSESTQRLPRLAVALDGRIHIALTPDSLITRLASGRRSSSRFPL